METPAPPAGLTPLQSFIWQNILESPGQECFRALLALTGDYILSPDGDTILQYGLEHPDPHNWRHFLSPTLAGNIRVLKLDLSTVRNLPVWKEITQTAPNSFPLSQLRTLHVSLDHVSEQVDFACRFLRDSVRDLSLLIFPPYLRMAFRDDIPRNSDLPRDQLERFLDDVRDTWYPGYVAAPDPATNELLPIDQLFRSVGRMLDLERLQFVVSDVNTGYTTYPTLVEMLRKLKKLHTLVLARHTTMAPILCLLSGHLTLRSFGAFQAGFPMSAVRHREYDDHLVGWHSFWNLWDEGADQRTQQSVANLQKPMRETLQSLTLEIDPAQFHSVAQVWSHKSTPIVCPKVTRLHLHCSTSESGLQEGEFEVHQLLALLPGLFPALRELRVGPIRWNNHSANDPGTPRFCVTATALRALTALPTLEVLALEAVYAPFVSAAEWAKVLPSWPNLRVLRLQHTQRLYVRKPTVPLDTLLCVFERHCPTIEELAVAAAASIAGPAGTWRFPPALRKLDVAYDHHVENVERVQAFVQRFVAGGGEFMGFPLFHHDELPKEDWEAKQYNRELMANRVLTATITGVGLDQALADQHEALAPWRITI